MATLFIAISILFLNLANARTLDVAVGWTKPPYVLAGRDSGFELDLIKNVMESMGYYVNFVYVPYARSYTLLEKGDVDVSLTLGLNGNVDAEKLSEPYITYQNVAVSLKTSGIVLNTIKDLELFSIVAFQNASTLLGDAFTDVASKSPLYIELPEQRRQVEMLFLGNTETVVMDVNIFNHLSERVMKTNQMARVDVHVLFPSSDYRAGFKDVKLKDAFNSAVEAYRKSKDYEALVAKYDLYSVKLSPATRLAGQ